MIFETLKDLGVVGVAGYKGKTYSDVELKVIGIKWYKDMEAEQPYGTSTKCVMKWIEIFFNLTKEDLK